MTPPNTSEQCVVFSHVVQCVVVGVHFIFGAVVEANGVKVVTREAPTQNVFALLVLGGSSS